MKLQGAGIRSGGKNMLMQTANQIVREYAKRGFGMELDVGTLSLESVMLSKEEIDIDLIPSDDHQKGNNYVFGLVVDLSNEGDQGIEYAVCLKEVKLFEGNINWHRLLSEYPIFSNDGGVGIFCFEARGAHVSFRRSLLIERIERSSIRL
jgi:hypothetical protein